METSFVLTVADEEHRLSLPSAWVMEAEKKLGESLLAAMDHIDRTSVIATVLWAAMQKLDHGMTMNKVTALIDRMLLDGCEFGGVIYEDFSIEVRVKLYTQLMVISGFFTKETAQTMLEETTKN